MSPWRSSLGALQFIHELESRFDNTVERMIRAVLRDPRFDAVQISLAHRRVFEPEFARSSRHDARDPPLEMRAPLLASVCQPRAARRVRWPVNQHAALW